ncbi:DUF262 domain-containing protein [Emticicia sp. BO119]|uniref:GmrSD restriction endonuclease domain-containing protein n=1 Tax=Emticicia sp. BO119 TaxID=2757768 RepID=UPI0015EFE213|nr:DUF262 domain-containing protein [Emticicia sp. BO119]MBA4851238.1 DUF262 domain-containing protein [Emticicia sp. BO119]
MSYQTALTIASVVKEIHGKKYLLPAIQREFVWNTSQIERLFDSLMRDYPISSFLFWQVGKEKVNDYQFYEFLRIYHEKNHRHNPKANINGDEEIIAVLDGQQRLTSIYIGLKGNYSSKMPKKRWDNEQAYPQKKLYLNLLNPSNDFEFQFDFLFLTEEEAQKKDSDNYWFPVGNILNLKESFEVNSYLIENGLFSDYGKEKASFANKALSKLHEIIHIKPAISYYLEKSDELDKVLNIFIRINSGGTVLSYSDLLLSIATAQWEEKDAREEITNFVDEINNIGLGFNINKDFVLKACLVLNDFGDIAFKVDNFNKENMLKIEKNWDNICKSIRLAFKLISSFGFSRDTLTSNNAIIPIAYYLLKIGLPDNFSSNINTNKDRIRIKKWLILTFLKKVFSGQPDNILRSIRKIIIENNGDSFPLGKIIDNFKGTPKSLIFSNEDIDHLISNKYGQPSTFAILSLLYPTLNFNYTFHIDHLYPKSKFNQRMLRKLNVMDEDVEYYLSYVDSLPNLQILESTPNIQKSDSLFDEWMARLEGEEQDDYKKRHYIPNVNFDFNNFIQFFKEREKLLLQKLRYILESELDDDIS